MAGELLVTASVLVLLLTVWLLWWTGFAAQGAAQDQITALQQQWHGAGQPEESAPPAGAASSSRTGAFVPEAVPDVREPASGRAFAVLRIPRFGRSWQRPVLQGTSIADLRRGVGHYIGTAMPGVAGNLAIAGHRTTWGHPFGDIQRLRRGDPIIVETGAGWFIYRVTGHQVIRPDQRSVIAAVPGRPGQRPSQTQLTLTSCHPKYSARQRFVVHAELETSRARSAGPPPGLGA